MWGPLFPQYGLTWKSVVPLGKRHWNCSLGHQWSSSSIWAVPYLSSVRRWSLGALYIEGARNTSLALRRACVYWGFSAGQYSKVETWGESGGRGNCVTLKFVFFLLIDLVVTNKSGWKWLQDSSLKVQSLCWGKEQKYVEQEEGFVRNKNCHEFMSLWNSHAFPFRWTNFYSVNPLSRIALIKTGCNPMPAYLWGGDIELSRISFGVNI